MFFHLFILRARAKSCCIVFKEDLQRLVDSWTWHFGFLFKVTHWTWCFKNRNHFNRHKMKPIQTAPWKQTTYRSEKSIIFSWDLRTFFVLDNSLMKASSTNIYNALLFLKTKGIWLGTIIWWWLVICFRILKNQIFLALLLDL